MPGENRPFYGKLQGRLAAVAIALYQFKDDRKLEK